MYTSIYVYVKERMYIYIYIYCLQTVWRFPHHFKPNF